MTLMAVDFGSRRIGIAVTDTSERLALSVGTFRIKSESDGIDQISRMAEARRVREIILGLPLSHDGGETQMSGRVRAFAEKLRLRLSIRITFEDERHTTEAAEAPLKVAGLSGRKRRGKVDAGAATVLLQSVLRKGPPPQ